jgi:hypothetical protein
VALHSNRWRTPGALFDDATIRVHTGVEEFMIAAPVPGCGRKGLEDGKAEPIILCRLYLDSSGRLN